MSDATPEREDRTGDRVVKTDAEWRAQLTREEFDVARRRGTERAFTGRYWNHTAAGLYRCVCCGAPLFASTTKFDAGCGWPSFWAPVAGANVATRPDDSHFMHRTEILCARCDAHLGHVFPDGPAPTGERYCVNSASLAFEPDAGDRG